MSKQITYEEFRYHFKKAFDEVVMPIINKLSDDRAKKDSNEIKIAKFQSTIIIA